MRTARDIGAAFGLGTRMANMTTPDEAPPRQLVDIGGAARLLGVPVRHVRRLVAERRVPYIKWGSRLHFDPLELEQWIDRHRVTEREMPEVG
jgi:excisionase family DNA binding protein